MPIGRRQFVRLAVVATLAMAGVVHSKDLPFAVYQPKAEAALQDRLPSSVRKQLDAVALATTEKRKTGKGVKVVFSGPAGTDRTMAAQVLASEAGRGLYVVDVGRLISKYVGETEKNLDRLLTEAQQADVVLFFDEADDLFGKRTDAQDSKDRYANLDVGYLLQRLEAFEGVAILATNNAANIDEALVRRSDAVIKFSTKPIKPPAAQ